MEGKTKNKRNQNVNLIKVQVAEGTEFEPETGEKIGDERVEAEPIEELF